MQIVGCKFARLTDIIENEIPHNCKVIVFSRFVEVLRLCETAINAAVSSGKMKKRSLSLVIGKKSKKERIQHFANFQTDNGDGAILLVLYILGGIGLNLIGSHYGIFMEPQFNPQVELQAADRM